MYACTPAATYSSPEQRLPAEKVGHPPMLAVWPTYSWKGSTKGHAWAAYSLQVAPLRPTQQQQTLVFAGTRHSSTDTATDLYLFGCEEMCVAGRFQTKTEN